MAAAVSVPPLALSGGRYEAVLTEQGQPRYLGGGTYGRVYQYRDTQRQGRLVAVKRISLTNLEPGQAQQLIKLLPREVRVHRSLRHPHVLNLWDAFVEADCLNLVLEYATGGTALGFVNGPLWARTLQGAPALATPEQWAVREGAARWMFQQLVVVLDYLQTKGVAHRDIKLENALLNNGPFPLQPLIKVADFGMSRFDDQGLATTPGLGTACYMAPEMVQAGGPNHPNHPAPGAPYDASKADTWSAGVLLYAMLMKNYPFHGETPQQLLPQMLARPLRGLPVYMSPGCKAFLEAVLHPDPEQRLSIQQIRQHEWFARDLPANAFEGNEAYLQKPSLCFRSEAEVEGVLEEVMLRLQALV